MNSIPFLYSDNGKCYHTFDYYTRHRFGTKTVKLPLDGGFTCPNRDGTKGSGGCIYCSQKHLPYAGLAIKEQYEIAKSITSKKWAREGRKECYIPYFQTFTGTYAPLDRLRELYYSALELPGCVGLSIGTRADCIDGECEKLLRELDKKTYLTIELGLQTVHDRTAELINRRHTYSDFLECYKRLSGLNICVHLIDYLPGESRDMMLESAYEVGKLRPHEVKLHMLYAERGTKLGDMYEEGKLTFPDIDEYTDTVISQLELLPPETVIGRLTGDGDADMLLAPLWTVKKFDVLNHIDAGMKKRGTCQGACFDG